MDGFADDRVGGLKSKAGDAKLIFDGQITNASLFFDFTTSRLGDSLLDVQLDVTFGQNPDFASFMLGFEQSGEPLAPFLADGHAAGRQLAPDRSPVGEPRPQGGPPPAEAWTMAGERLFAW